MNAHRRRLARNLARAGTALCGAMLALSLATMSSERVSAAASNGGDLQVLSGPDAASVGIPIFSGGSVTKFYLRVPAAAACTGDTATGGYRVQSYMVPASVNPATLTFNSSGPIPAGTGANLRQPLFATSEPYLNANTAVASADGTGAIVGNPAFDFAVFGSSGPAVVPNGTYNVGIACTLGDASATQLDKYWNVQLTFTADAADQPSGIKWTTPNQTVTTTVAAATTTVAAATTTVAGATTTVAGVTTTVAGATTTTRPTIATSTTRAPVASSGGSGNNLSATGGSPLPIVFWAILLLVFGRMAILLGRPLRVLPDSQ
jgi:hypothetical protein